MIFGRYDGTWFKE